MHRVLRFSPFSLMSRLYFIKCHSLELQAQTDAAREVFPTRVTRGLYQTLGEDCGGFFSPLF
jgi:hypothetical protein